MSVVNKIYFSKSFERILDFQKIVKLVELPVAPMIFIYVYAYVHVYVHTHKPVLF